MKWQNRLLICLGLSLMYFGCEPVDTSAGGAGGAGAEGGAGGAGAEGGAGGAGGAGAEGGAGGAGGAGAEGGAGGAGAEGGAGGAGGAGAEGGAGGAGGAGAEGGVGGAGGAGAEGGAGGAGAEGGAGGAGGAGAEGGAGGAGGAMACGDDECGPAPRVAMCPDGSGPPLECVRDDGGLCGWVVGPCPCSDADQDGVCDDADDLCNPDGAAVICDALPPNCRPGTVPLVVQGCFANDCVSWEECAAVGPPVERCRDNADCDPGERCDAGGCLPCACPEIFAPVCGSDGMTYDNDCFANCAGVDVVGMGPCEEPGQMCGGFAGIPCPDGQACVDDPDDDCDPRRGGADCPGVCVPQNPGQCAGDQDCEDGSWCRPTENRGEMLCVPFATEGEDCGGFRLPWTMERCEPGLVCADEDPLLADEPGVCRSPCVNNRECDAQEYCAADGVCRDDASCVSDLDCEQPGNDFRREACDGRAVCQNNMCEWACGGPDLCADFYYQVCQDNDDCRDGYQCGAPRDGCTSSSCLCDPETGDIGVCTDDCLQDARLCEPCIGDGCVRPVDCADAGECVNGAWCEADDRPECWAGARPICHLPDSPVSIERCGGPCADADGDGICDANDRICNRDGSQLQCRMAQPECGRGEVPVVVDGCYDGCTDWANCGVVAGCRDNDDCPPGTNCVAGECAPCVCPAVFQPVCGENGNTYGNACLAACEGVAVVADGPCAGEPQACGGILGELCPMGEVCVDDPDDDCDPRNGGADCPGICQPDVACDNDGPVCALFCEHGFVVDENGCALCQCNPAPGDLCADWYYQPCQDDAACEPGYQCGEVIDECVASNCMCDPATGEAGACTRDCLRGFGLCEPCPPGGCNEPEPCDLIDCAPGFECVGGECLPGEGGLCDDWYYQPCQDDAACDPGYQCGAVIDGCVASNCQCDPATGLAGFCTRDCLQGVGLCEPCPNGDCGGADPCALIRCEAGFQCVDGDCVPDEPGLCEDFLHQLCDDDNPCPEGYACGDVQPDCTPSTCNCEPATGVVLCTRDCILEARLCEPCPNGVCEPVVGCNADNDCAPNEWCRPTENLDVSACVPYQPEGESCGGFVPVFAQERCTPGLTCANTNRQIPDLPGICSSPCRGDADCEANQYCSGDNVCRSDGSCLEVADCEEPGNDYARPLCVGSATCELGVNGGVCGWMCDGPVRER